MTCRAMFQAAVLLAWLACGNGETLVARATDDPHPPNGVGKDGDPTPAGQADKVAKVKSDTPTARFNLQEGLVGETTDGSFRYHVGGRFDWDSGWYQASHLFQQSLDAPLLDGTDLRRFRLGVDGTLWQTVDFKVEADFSRASDFKKFQSTPDTNIFITDAWLALRDLPIVGTLKAGHQKEYLTFANATSANFLPFMERPYIFDAFENDFSWDLGVSLSQTYCDDRVTSWAGVFWNGTRSQAFNVNGHYAASGRLTWLPVDDAAAQQWVNLGVSGSVRAFNGADPNSVTVRPLVRTGESFQVPDLIDTGNLLTQHSLLHIAGAGAHAAWGPWTVGGEFLCWSVADVYLGGLPNPDGSLPAGAVRLGDLFFSGYYLEALVFLTPGDHRPVNKATPGYARVKPVSPLQCDRDDGGAHWHGLGAWEIGVRYDHVDVNCGAFQAGTLDSVTGGVNWYLNANARVTANYVYTSRYTGLPTTAGSFNALGLRVHVDF
jgi:phosphate-selective porin OprO/OprP